MCYISFLLGPNHLSVLPFQNPPLQECYLSFVWCFSEKMTQALQSAFVIPLLLWLPTGRK